MKTCITVFLMLSALMSGCFISCSSSDGNHAEVKEGEVKDHIEVIYFHGNMRCLTCRAMEKYAKETLDSLFKDDIKSGKVIFKVVDITNNEIMADDYQTTGSSLFVTSFFNGQEIRKDMTRYGFRNVRKHHEVFQDSLASVIRQSLNKMKL